MLTIFVLLLLALCFALEFVSSTKTLEQTLLENPVEIDVVDEDNGDGDHRELTTTVNGKKFNIALGYATAASVGAQEGFTLARTKWQQVITNDTASTTCFKAGRSFCGFKLKKKTCVDDLFIGIHIQPIDGVGGV